MKLLLISLLFLPGCTKTGNGSGYEGKARIQSVMSWNCPKGSKITGESEIADGNVVMPICRDDLKNRVKTMRVW